MDKAKHDKPTEPCLECGKYFDDCECDYFNIGSSEKYDKQVEKMLADRNHPAQYTVFWPGQTVHTCQRHFDGLNKLNDAMGGVALDYREEAGNQCENCVNEAKKVGD